MAPTCLDSFISLDIESTGTDPLEARIVELGICEFTLTDGILTKVKPFAKLFNPGVPISKRATEVHGITNEHVKDKPLFSQAAPNLNKYLAGCICVGYNIFAFDGPLLKAEFARAGIARPFDGVTFIDAYPFVREDYGSKRRPLSKKLTDQCDWWGIKLLNAHSAASDAEAAGRLLMVMQSWPARKPIVPWDLGEILEMQAGLRAELDKPVQVELIG